MRHVFIAFLILTACLSSKAQSDIAFQYDTFEMQVLAYEPSQNTSTSKKNFDYGKMILRETKSATVNNPSNFNLSDYFNILSAFITLRESEANIKLAFEKFEHSEGSCEYVIDFEESIEANPKFDIVRTAYRQKLAECKGSTMGTPKFDIEGYCADQKLDFALVQKMDQISRDDALYRKTSKDDLPVKQAELDQKNQQLIESLCREYGTYIGKGLVGDKYESVMWAVIQHSNVEMMGHYLPLIHKAVKDNELPVAPLKMLIDRFYGLKFGYQVFGTQSGFGFDLAGEERRMEIELEYGI